MTQTRTVSTSPGRISSVVAVLLLSGIILDIQYGALSPLVGTIATESELSPAQVGWVLNALMIGIVISVSLTARMGDIFGHRKVLIGLTVLALIGSALAATVTGFVPLIIGRLLMGMAVTIPLGWGLLRPRATASVIQRVALVLSLGMAVMSPVAMVVGGFIVELGLPWETVFWVNFAMFALLLVFALVAPETPESSRATVHLDWFGALGLGLWVTSILVAFSEGPSIGWTEPLVLVSFAIGIVLLIAWVVQQRRTEVPVASFKDMDVRQALIGYSGILLPAFLGQGLFIALPSLLQTPTVSGFGLGLTTLQSTFVLLSIIPGSVIGYVWTGWAVANLGPRLFLVISGTGGVVVFVGFAIAHSAVWMIALWVFLYSLTVMCCLTTGYILVASAGRQDNMATTVGLQYIVQFVGSAVPVAVVVSLLVPGDGGYIPESVFTGIYFAGAIIGIVFVVGWAIAAPRTLTDRHAIDVSTVPTIPSAATPVDAS